jgi:hypothetical protein
MRNEALEHLDVLVGTRSDHGPLGGFGGRGPHMA